MLGTLLYYSYRLITSLIRIYSFIWFIWIVISWLRAFGAVQVDPYNKIFRILAALTDGVIDRVFGNLRYKFVVGMMDFSPFIFLIVLTYIFPRVLAWLFNMLLALVR